MLSLARVLSFSAGSENVIVSRIVSSACINCPSIKNCIKVGKSFTAANPKHLQLSEGSFVQIDLSGGFKVLTGLLALFIPIFMCALACIFSSEIFSRFSIFQTEEIFKFILCISAFFIGEAVVIALKHTVFRFAKTVILQVV